MNVETMTTEELEAILKADAEHVGEEPNTEVLMPVLEELARRHREQHPNAKTAEQAFQEFLKHYAPESWCPSPCSNPARTIVRRNHEYFE